MADEKIPDPEQVNESTTATNELSAAIKKLTQDASVLKSMMTDVNKEIRSNFESLVQAGKVTEENVETLNAYLDTKAKVIKAEKDGGTASEELIADLELYKQMLDEVDPSLVKFADSLSEHAVAAQQANIATKALNKTLQGFSNVLSFANMGSLDFTSGLMSMANSLKQTGLQFDEFNKNVEVLTGLGPQSAEISQDLVNSSGELGITLDETSEAQGALNQSFRSFGLLSKESQKAITDQTVALSRLGVSAEAQARAMDLLRFSMGGTDENVKDLIPRLDKLAVSLGLPTGQLVEDFNKLGPQLARFGKGAESQFRKLASTARSLGMDVQAAFDIAESVDTFEGAADMAGKLNAQLGLQINSVELLNADHNERINIMRREFQQSGKNFDDMGRRQRQAVAEMLGVDVDMASRLFGDPMSFAKVDAERAEALERSKQLTTANQRLAAAADKVTIALEPVATAMANLAVGIANVVSSPFVVYLSLTTGLIYGLTKAFLALKAGMALLRAAREADTVSQAFKILMNKKESDSNETLSETQDKVAKSSKFSMEGFKNFAKAAKDLALPIAALGVAMLALGGGIYFAATGMAILVDAFAGVGENAMAAALGIGLLIIPFVAFVAAAAFMATTGVGFAAAAVLAAMGFGALMLGGGIALAAYGMSLFVESIKGLTEGEASAGVQLLQTLPELFLAVGTAGFLLGFAVKPLLAVGIAIAGIGLGIGIVSSRFDLLAASMLRVVDASKSMTANLAGFEAIERIITVSTNVTPVELENMERVMGAVVRVGETARATEATGLDRLADSILNMFTGTGGGSSTTQKEVVLQVDGKKLGKVIVDILTDEYGMRIAR